MFAKMGLNQFDLTKNGVMPLELGGNEAKGPVEASGAGLSGVLKSNRGAPPKSSSSKMAEVRAQSHLPPLCIPPPTAVATNAPLLLQRLRR